MSARVNKGMRWFKWVLWLLLITFGIKALFAFGQPNSVNKLALAALGFVGGTILLGGAAFFLGWLTGKEDIPVSPGLNPVSSPAEIPPELRVTTFQSSPNPTLLANVIPTSSISPVQGRTMISTAEAVDEDGIYNSIAHELETGIADKGLWTRLFAECEGDEKKTKVLYIKQRADKLISAERSRLEEVARQQADEAVRRNVLEEQQAQRAYTAIPKGTCPNCDAVIPLESQSCPKCSANFEKGAAWRIRPLWGGSETPEIEGATRAPAGKIEALDDKAPFIVVLLPSLAFVLLVAGLIFFSDTKGIQPNDGKTSPAESALEPVVAVNGKPEAASGADPKTGELMPWEKKWDYTPPVTTNSARQPPPFTLDQYDWEGARKAGLSNSGILDYLNSNGALGGYDLAGARKAGIPDDEIADFLAKKRSSGKNPIASKRKSNN